MTAVEVASADYARALTDKIKVAVEGTWHLITEAYQSRAWSALGYLTWDDYCTREFGTSRLALPREDRAETVQSLRSAGLSLRAIESATGLGKSTVQRQLAPVPNGTPEPAVTVEETTETSEEIDARLGPIGHEVDFSTGEIITELAGPGPITPTEHHPTPITGLDGKRYTAPTPRKAPRKSLVDTAKTRGFALREATDSLVRIFSDDRIRTNEKQVADVLRGHLLYVAETVAAVLDQLP